MYPDYFNELQSKQTTQVCHTFYILHFTAVLVEMLVWWHQIGAGDDTFEEKIFPEKPQLFVSVKFADTWCGFLHIYQNL